MFAIRCIKGNKYSYSLFISNQSKYFMALKEHTKLKSTFHRGVNYLFKKNLLLTNSISSGAFVAIGDLVHQEYEVQAKTLLERYDWLRTVRMFIVGVMLGSLHHYYYIKLDKILPKNDYTTIVKKIFYDQLIVSPLSIVCFFFGMGILERKTIQQSTEEIKKKFKYVYMGDCFFWPPVQFINFYYLPTEYRVVYINLATMIFNVFLSYMKHYDQYGK